MMAVFAGCRSKGETTHTDNSNVPSSGAQENESLHSIVLTDEIIKLTDGLSAVRYSSDYEFDLFLDQGGASLFGRNFDWDTCNAMVIQSQPENGYNSISTVNTDFINMNGMNLSRLPDQMQALAGLYAPLDELNEMVVTEPPAVTNFYIAEGEKNGIGTRESHERYKVLMNHFKDSETIEHFIEDLQKGKETSGLKRLAAHRKNLLDSLHREQKCIDCLDYLVYRIKKTKK